MGFDVDYQAVPDDSLVDLACRDVEDGWGLGLLHSWFRHGHDGPRRPNRICEAAQRVAAEHPQIKSMNCSLDRSWDALHYLLSATRRGEQSCDADRTIDCAFDDPIVPLAEHVRGGQGVPILYIQRERVSAIANLLAPTTENDLIAHYDPARMESEAVYKFWANRVPAEVLPDWIVAYFKRLKEFFIACAEHNYAAIRNKD
jgi:hypothetical protein